MEEIEDPTERLQENINEKAQEGRERWSFYVALSTALMAVLAAISGLISGDHANEALLAQAKASDQWAFYQAKSIKSEIAASTCKITNTADTATIMKYDRDKEQIKQKAEASEQLSEFHLEKHKILARSVTMFQIAIAISAISILTRKRLLWVGSIALAAAGIGFLIQGIAF